MKKLILYFTFFLLIWLAFPLPVTAQVVDIPDSNLRAAVEKALGKASGATITTADMANLPHLEARNANIGALTGLESATSLTKLDLGDNAISDISVLAGLTNLTELLLPVNKITDISVLAGLPNLINLALGYNAITDHSILSGLTNLTLLDLRGTNTSDLSVLSGLTKLEQLYIDSNGISDLSPLAGLTNLKAIGLNFNSISDLSPLTSLTNLEWLRFVDNNITDLSPLVANTGLGDGDWIDVQENPLSYASIHAHIPTLQGRGITVEFDHSDTESAPITADVNGDGSVNILDLVVIASELGNAGIDPAVDVNGDGAVNVLDLILVAGMFDGAAAAPSAQPQGPETLTAVEVQGWLTDARALEVRDPIMKRGFVVLEQLLVSLTPKETELLPNYPNPFNPETWIPYRLAEDTFVTLTIYDSNGRTVRTLEVGHRIASAYENRSKAIYWDGRNDVGERVASGVYFYTLSAGEYSATRRMLIIK